MRHYFPFEKCLIAGRAKYKSAPVSSVQARRAIQRNRPGADGIDKSPRSNLRDCDAELISLLSARMRYYRNAGQILSRGSNLVLPAGNKTRVSTLA
jgi:hypothetical protein